MQSVRAARLGRAALQLGEHGAADALPAPIRAHAEEQRREVGVVQQRQVHGSLRDDLLAGAVRGRAPAPASRSIRRVVTARCRSRTSSTE